MAKPHVNHIVYDTEFFNAHPGFSEENEDKVIHILSYFGPIEDARAEAESIELGNRAFYTLWPEYSPNYEFDYAVYNQARYLGF